MDGRGRQGSNSGIPSSAPASMMSNYGYGGSEGSSAAGPYARDRFWSAPTNSSGTDPWGSNSYTPQLELSSFSNSSSLNQNYIPYGGGQANGSTGDLTFSGPSPPNPNQLQPISISSSPYPPPSPCRQYTPNSTPSPHVGSQSKQQQHQQINGNGINGNSHHSSGSSSSGSPPNNNNNNNNPSRGSFQAYNINDDQHQQQQQHHQQQQQHHDQPPPPNNNGPHLQNGHMSKELNNGAASATSEYLQHSRMNSRYSNDINKSGGGDNDPNNTMQYGHHPYYQNYGYPTPYYQESGYHRPYDPYQPYGSGGSGGSSSYPPPPSLPPHTTPAEYHSAGDYHHERSSTSSSTDPGKTQQDLLPTGAVDSSNSSSSSRKIDSSTTKENQSNKLSHDTFSGGEPGGRSFDNNLMTLNNSSGGQHHPQDSSSCSSQSPSSFDLQFPHHKPLGPGPLGGSSSSPTKLEESSSTNEKKSPRADLEKTEAPIVEPKAKNSRNRSSPPDLGELKTLKLKSTPQPPPPPKPAPVKKKRRKKQSAAAQSKEKDKEKDYDFSRVKEEPKDLPSSDGKLKKQQLMTRNDDHHHLHDDVENEDLDDLRDDDDKKDLKDVPMVECGCFPADEIHAEPGPFYTHLGAAHNLVELRKIIENRTGFRGNQVRLEKVIYTGKEGKTSHGCPLAKWILRRGSYEEQLLFLVKHRKGHKCATAWIVVCCVIWEGVPPHFADNLYDTVVYKLNRFGIPTTRRSDTNEQRSCACQGVDPDTCGAAYSFGCAWSMFFNGCKYARSRNVRKFRLTEEHEESELEEKVQHLATHLAPLYERVAPDSYTNQIDHENEGLECRLGYRPGRPFSGVTACLDYCSHAHKDAHNMMNGCTVTVSLTRNRALTKGEDEQFHVLPLYKLDDTDEHGSKEGQKQKIKKGQLEILKKFPCKVRIRKVPLLPSRRRAKAKTSASSGGAAIKAEPASVSMPAPAPSLPSPVNSSISMKSPSDYCGGSDMPPAKREKLFDDRLANGTSSIISSGGDPYGENRFHPSSSYQGFNPSAESNSSSNNWNHFGSSSASSGQQNSRGPISHHMSSQQQQQQQQPPPPPTSLGSNAFSSYFDHSFPGGNSTTASVGHITNGSSSLTSLTELTNSTSMSRHGSSSNLTNLSSSASSNILSSPGSSGGNPGSASSGYSSMSPILPSFRNTFMTEAESMGMISSMSSPGSSQPDSTSSPRSKQSNGPQTTSSSSSGGLQQNIPTPAFASSVVDHSSPYSYASQGSYASGPPGGIYHPQPHNPCLPPPHHLSSYGSAAASASFGHHLPESHYGMGMNPLGYPSYSSNYAAAAAYGSYGQPIGNIGMGASNFPHPMSQYSPYQNRIPHQQQIQHGNSWGAPSLNPFTPPAMPNMNLNMHHPQHPPQPPPSCFVTPPKPKVIPEVNESFSDNEDCFKDPQMGGVAIALTHGSVILQCAKHEMHATTALKGPNRMYPSRICMIFYQHKSMNNRFHGWSEWEKKIEAKKLQEVKLINQGKMEASPRKMKQLIKEGYIQDNQ